METLEFVVMLGVLSMTGLVGIAIWLHNMRAVEQMRQDNLNFRASMKSGVSSPGSVGDDGQDSLSQIIDYVMKNPQILQSLGGALQSGDQNPKM